MGLYTNALADAKNEVGYAVYMFVISNQFLICHRMLDQALNKLAEIKQEVGEKKGKIYYYLFFIDYYFNSSFNCHPS